MLKRLKFKLDDISKMEINSMLVDGILARKMPHPTAAFCEIISAWVPRVVAIFNQAGLYPAGQAPAEAQETASTDAADTSQDVETKFINTLNDWEVNKATLFTDFVKTDRPIKDFAKNDTVQLLLNEVALNGIRKEIETRKLPKKAQYIHADLFRLLKLQTRIGFILETYAAAPDGEPEFRFRQELRKLWELKDGYIYAQNIFQVDGDIMTRINRRLYEDKQAGQYADELLEFHKKNVEVGVANWHFLVNTLVEIGKAFFGKLNKLQDFIS